MKIKIPYGQGHLDFTPPVGRTVHILKPQSHGSGQDINQEDLIKKALANPIDSPKLSELAKGKNKIVIITSDHTRPVPSSLTLPPMLEEIRRGSPEADISILIAVGSHRPTSKTEMAEKFGQDLVDREKIINHDPHDASNLVSLGKLPSGGELVLNKMAVEADLLLADGFIEPHTFAGFSGGRKSVLPGIASLKTVLANHNAQFTVHPKAKAGNLEANPFQQDMVFAAEKAKLAFIVNVVLDGDKKVIAAFAGQAHQAHLEGCRFVLDRCQIKATPAPVVICSNGGYPLDQNIYQSTKSIMSADLTCETGGVIIAVNECRDGHGGESFYQTFVNAPSIQHLLDEIQSRPPEQTQPEQWFIQLLGSIVTRRKVILVSKAPVEVVKTLGMIPADSIEEALSMADSFTGRHDGPINILPDAVSVIIN